ncbi:MAG TPA: hypothetical protein VKU02_25145 [Gemmataceae bacterium]|nr:hypothetical protein [Gemmataceae bacterium]
MGWFKHLFKPSKPPLPSQPVPEVDVALLLLIHSHPKDALPPGPLEDDFIALEQDDVVLHAVAGTMQPDGTIRDLPEEKLEWARQLTYRHLKREGCLADFGIPIMPAYESDAAAEQRPSL